MLLADIINKDNKVSNSVQFVTNSLIQLGDDIETETNGKGRKFVSRFIEAGIAHYNELGNILITKETLDKFLNTMVGCPLVIQHKEITDKNVDKERVGVISDVWYNDKDGWFYCSGVIWDKKAIDLIKNHNWNVSCTYEYVSDFTPRDYNGGKIDMEFTDGKFLYLALVDNPRYTGANIVINSRDNVNNGFITLDAGTSEERVIWIPENVHWVPPKERNRVTEITKNYKEGEATKFDFSHTRIKPTDSQINLLKDTVKDIQNRFKFKGLAQVEITSSLNSGSFGVCFAGKKSSLVSLAPSLFKENGKEQYKKSVESGWLAKASEDCIKSVLVHEIGHSITCNSNNKEFWSEIENLKSQYNKEVKPNDIKNADFISKYARENKDEFVAEAFCQGMLSKKYGKFTQKVMDLMDKHFSKAYQTKLALNAKDDEENNNEMWIEGYGFGYPIDEEEYKKAKEELEKLRKKEEKQVNNSNRKDNLIMAVMDELKDFIVKVVNNECDKKVKNEDVDKRELLREVDAIAMKPASEFKGGEEEKFRTLTKKLEELGYNKSLAGTSDNEDEEEKEEDKKAENNKKCKNEDDEDKEEYEKAKEIADNKKVNNSLSDETVKHIADMIMGGKKIDENISLYTSQEERLKLGENY